MNIAVGSTNPVKINSVTIASSETWPEVVVKGFGVESGISEQPRSDQETKQGAINRAKAVLAVAAEHGFEADLGMGLEGGVYEDDDGQMWSTVWAVLADAEGSIWEVNGARFRVPEPVANVIRTGGEMGPIMAKLTGEESVKTKQGMLGVITKGFIDRTEEYTGLAKLVLGLWHGRDWTDALDSDTL